MDGRGVASSSGASSLGGEAIRPGGDQRRDESALLVSPRGDGFASLGEGEQAEREPLGDVRALPPPCEGRQVMRRNAGDRQRRIARRRKELGAPSLEPQHPHAGDIFPRQPLAKAFRHRAEILADHHAFGALALKRDLTDQIVEWIGQIGSLCGLRSIGDEKEPRSPIA